VVIVAAFLYGYKRDSVSYWAERARHKVSQESTVKAPEDAPALAPAPVEKGPVKIAPLPAAANPYQDAMNAYRRMGNAAVPQNMRAPGSFVNTLDSIQPGAVTNDQVNRRNAYFEKLSQQLKELRGEIPPPASPEPGAAAEADAAPVEEPVEASPPAESSAPAAPELPPGSQDDEVSALEEEIDEILEPAVQ